MRNVLEYCSVPVLIIVLLLALPMAAVALEKSGVKEPVGKTLTPPKKSKISPPQLSPGSKPATAIKQQQTGYCCMDGSLREADPADCRKRGGRYFSNRVQAERSCTGFCCSDGEVTERTRDDCLARLKGTFFADRKEALANCRGWCCAKFEVSSSDASRCRSQGGSFFDDKVRAERFCREQQGWCCIDGTVKTLNRQDCRLRKGAFYEDPRLAKQKCRAERGFCNVAGKTIQLSDSECRSRRGTFFDNRLKAQQALKLHGLQAPRAVVQEQGWCCTGGQLFSSDRQDCDRRSGRFFAGEGEARKNCGGSETLQVLTPAGRELRPVPGAAVKPEQPQITQPDLAIGKISADADCRLNVVIENRGGPIAPTAFKKSSIRISAGPENRLPAAKQYLHRADPTGRLMRSGGSVVFNTDLEIGSKQGVMVWLDFGNDITEGNEKNNREVRNLSCSAPKTEIALAKPLRTVGGADKPAAPAADMRQMAGSMPELTPPAPSQIVPRLAGDIFGIRVTEPVRGGYITKGAPARVAWQPAEDASESCRARGNVAVRLLGPGGFSELLYSGPETASGAGSAVELGREAFADVPDGPHYRVLVEKVVADGDCRGESWEFSVGPIRDLGGGDLAPGERVIEILDPDPGQAISTGELFRLRWRVLPAHFPALPDFTLGISLGGVGGMFSGFENVLTEHHFDFDNESRVYSATITLPCLLRGTGATLMLYNEAATADRVDGLGFEGLPEVGSGIHIYDPRPGIIKHVGDELALRWDLDPRLQECAAEYDMQQLLLICPGDEGETCTTQASVNLEARTASIPLTPGMEGTNRVQIGVGATGRLGIDYAISRSFTIIPPLPTDRPTFVWPNRATTLQRGSTYTISWTGMEREPGDRQLDIVLRNPAGRLAYHLLGTESANRGSFDWEIPLCDDRYLGDGYQFRLRVLDDESFSTDSVTFQIADTGAHFTGDAGRAGSFWEFDTLKRITWRFDHPLPAGTTVDLMLNKGGEHWLTIARGVDAGRGSYNWFVGSEWLPDRDFEGTEIGGEIEFATGYMGGLVHPSGSDYSFVIQASECPGAVNAEGPMIRLGR